RAGRFTPRLIDSDPVYFREASTTIGAPDPGASPSEDGAEVGPRARRSRRRKGRAARARLDSGCAWSDAGPRVRQGPDTDQIRTVEGLIDFHVHCAPDVFGRSIDDDEEVTLARDGSLEALVLKNHVALTADRAWLVRKHVPGVKVFGGIVLNSAVGGINPEAVQWMWRMQGGFGRVVWFPTFAADHHVKHFKDAPEGTKVG